MKDSRTFVIGDIHGGYKALIQCLNRSGFDYDCDHLISLGDICDGWSETNLCIDELLKIRHCTMVMGNHDYWTLQWAKTGQKDYLWLKQGGQATVDSYQGSIPGSHIAFLEASVPYYLVDNRLFVHAGIHTEVPLEEQEKEVFLWDRSLFRKAMDVRLGVIKDQVTDYDEVYIGHTSVHNYGFYHPVEYGGIWLMDTGAGWTGVLSIMDIDSKQYFTSDPVYDLYPDHTGRV